MVDSWSPLHCVDLVSCIMHFIMQFMVSRPYGGVLKGKVSLCAPSKTLRVHHVSKEGCCRHAFGDQYRATDIPIPGPGRLELVYHPRDGSEAQRFEVHDFDGSGALSVSAHTLQLLSLQPMHALQHPLPGSNKHALWPHQFRCQSLCSQCCPTEPDAQQCRLRMCQGINTNQLRPVLYKYVRRGAGQEGKCSHSLLTS